MPLYLCLPLLDNVPDPKNKDWKLTKCAICGKDCWETPQAKVMLEGGAIRSCTMCALREGTKNYNG